MKGRSDNDYDYFYEIKRFVFSIWTFISLIACNDCQPHIRSYLYVLAHFHFNLISDKNGF